jgi:hypothetical protein
MEEQCMYCKKCGFEIDGNSQFCPKCGTRIVSEDELLEISKSDIVNINGNAVPELPFYMRGYKNKPRIIISYSIGIIIMIISALSFHFAIGYGNIGMKIFPKDHLTFEYTIITTETVGKLISRFNSANLFERIQLQNEPIFKKLMDEGIIYRENE